MKIIGLDLANKAGVAICDYETPTKIQTNYLIGEPHEQLQQLSMMVNFYNKNIFIIEDFVYFGRNAQGTKSLIMRMGYFYYTLQQLNQAVILIAPSRARTWLKEQVENFSEMKKLTPKEKVYKVLLPLINSPTIVTNDITDAISLLITQQKLNYKDLEIEHMYKETT